MSKFTHHQAPGKGKKVVGKYAKACKKYYKMFLLLFSGCDREQKTSFEFKCVLQTITHNTRALSHDVLYIKAFYRIPDLLCFSNICTYLFYRIFKTK